MMQESLTQESSAHSRVQNHHAAKEVWKFVFESIIGYYEKSKAERGAIPAQGIQELWKNLAPTMPYRDPRNGAVVLYEEYSMGMITWSRDKIWDDLPWWAHGITFRITMCDITAVRASAGVIPTEILRVIYKYAFQSARYASSSVPRGSSLIDRDAILHISLTCRTWALERHQFLLTQCYDRGGAVSEVDVPRYIRLVAQHAKTWNLYYDSSSPAWLRRYMALYTSSRRRLLEDRIQHVDVRVKLDIASETTKNPWHKYRSIFTRYHKPLPPQCIPSLSRVKLSRRRFHSFADLSHLVWELPSLKQLECEHLSFANLHFVAPPTLRMQPSSQIRIVTTYCGSTSHFMLLMTSLFKIKTEKGTGILLSTDALLLVKLLESCAGNDWGSSKRRRMIFERHDNSCEAYIDRPRSFLRFNLEQIENKTSHNLCVSHLRFDVGYGSRSQDFDWKEIGKHMMKLPYIQEPFAICFPFLDEADLYPSAARVVSQLPNMWAMGCLEFFSLKYRLDDNKIEKSVQDLRVESSS